MKDLNWKKKTKGTQLGIEHRDGSVTKFIAGGRKRKVIEDGEYGVYVLVNAEVKLADGTKAHALLEIDESSSGEHCGTGVFKDDGGFVWQNEPNFLIALGKTSEEVYPYTYKCSAKLKCNDHHVGENGWSR